MDILSIILIILVLSLLVLIHEFGHFIASRKNGVRVEEFGLGYPPRIFGKQIGETIYSLNLIPFGGFIRITGEDAEDGKNGKEIKEINKDEYKNEKNYVVDLKSFSSKTPWQKIAILSAGIIMNLLLAVFLYYVFFVANGFRSFYIPMVFDHKFRFGEETAYSTVVFDMENDSPAQKAGISAGQTILKVDGEDISDYMDLRKHLSGKTGKDVIVETIDITDHTYKDRKTYIVIPVTNVNQKTEEDGDSIIGVYLGEAVSISYNKPLDKILSGPFHAYNMLSYSTDALWKIIKMSIVSRDMEPVSSSVTGPVGIYKIMSSILKDGGNNTILVLLDTVAIISLGFAFTNILPIPALDGGKIAFKLYEVITKKKVNSNFEENVHKVGMLLLLVLSVLITIKDLKL